MTGEPYDDLAGLDVVDEPRVAPGGGLRSLWDARHTFVALAILPGVFASNWLIAGWQPTSAGITLIVLVSLVQVLVIASYLPLRGDARLVRTHGALPVLAIFAASMLLSELDRSISLGAVALTLAATGAVFRFFAGTYED
ncbi:MAG: hypothetical protein J0I14_11455 [Propionibacteriaceae bacterium]|jgi:hypothetical protein|nr:hypothetical protein [Propionibacteriaceae bacterium]